VTKYRRRDPWDPNKVLIRLIDLFDNNTGNTVPEQDLYTGCWDIKVITDYFKDDPVNGIPGKYNLDLGGLDLADELLHREISDPVCFTVTKDPYINGVRPDKIPNGNTFEIYGANFGSIQGTSNVHVSKDGALIEIIGDGKGNEDGACQKAEYLEDGCTLDPAKTKQLNCSLWSNTKIRCKLPSIVDTSSLPMRCHMLVVVEETKKSNVKRIVIH